MTYNIHPIIVHFPIAFLFLYSVIKMIPFEKWLPGINWLHIQRFLLLVGLLGAFAASQTGEIAKDLTSQNHDLVEMHELFANITTYIYGILLVGEFLTILNQKLLGIAKYASLLKLTNVLQKIITNRIISQSLALLGFIAVALTGLLGGVMVYGLTADPMAGFVLKILGLSI